jgi:nucleotide-binding universal stress UspA family protein
MTTTPTRAPATLGVSEVSRILVPLDGSETSAEALPVAAAFAVRLGAAVEVVDCLPPAIPPREEGRWVEQKLEAVGLHADGLASVHSTVDVVGAITASAARVPGTVICMASHGRNAVGELVFGSVTHDVIVASPAPVLVVGPRCKVPHELGCIQVCVDGTRASEPIIDVATEWAGYLGAPIWLTQVVDPGVPDDLPGMRGDVVEGSVLARLAEQPRASGLDVEWDVLHGKHTGRAIAAWAEARHPALVVAGSHGRSSAARLRFGGVTGYLVHELEAPLLVVGPAAR